MKTAIFGIIGVFFICIVIYFIMSFSYNNKEIELRQLSEAQRGNIESVYDNMWKIISQKAQVSEQYKNAFKDIYPELIKGRYSDGSSLMKWIQESNPNFDVSLYKDLMKSIEIERTSFTKEQKRMIDIIREHKILCQKVPSKWFIDNKEEIQYIIISSDRTKDIISTGVDNDVDLFKK